MSDADSPAGWAKATVEELASLVQYGSSSKTLAAAAGAVAVLRMGNIIGGALSFDNLRYLPIGHSEFPDLLLKPGDILFNRTNSPELVGKTAVYKEQHPKPCSFASYLIRVRLQNYQPALLAAFINSERGRDWIRSCVSQQVGQANVSGGKLRSLEVPVPPLNEQRRIVAKLEDLLARSGRAKEALDAVPPLLEKLRQSILGAAFRGDLTADWRAKNPDVEPVAHLVARTPRPDGKSTGRDASVQVREGRHALAVGEPSRDAPPGWSWVQLLRIAKLESGHTPSRKQPEYWDGGVPWIGIKDAREHHAAAIHTTFQTVSEAGLANSAARLLPTRTVCLSRTASVGYVTIMGRAMATSQDFANWICSAALLPEFLMYALLAEGEGLRDFGEGTTHTTIYYPELKALHITLPPISEQHEIVTTLQARLGELARLKEAATSARSVHEAMAAAILAKAFRGELVAQDPNDEPASIMLERLAAERKTDEKPKRGRGPTKRARA